MEATRLTRSLSRFELGICVIIIALLFVYAIEKISELSVYTEETGIRIIIRNMQSNLDLYKSENIISGTTEKMAALIHTNPVNSVIPPPEGYLGEFEDPEAGQFGPGDWYFDKHSGYLVYHVRHPDRFMTTLPAPARIRLRLEPVYLDRNNNKSYDPGSDSFRGLVLMSPEKYEWR